MINTLKRKIGFNPLAWLVNTWRMRALVNDFTEPPSLQKGAPRFAVVITPWGGTSIPWFSLAIGLLLAKRGSTVTFVLDDFNFGDKSLRYQFVLYCIRIVLKIVRRRFDVIVLSTLHTDKARSDVAFATVKRLSRLNAVWEMRGEMIESGRKKFTDRCIKQLDAAYDPISKVMQQNAFDMVFIPGGVYGTSGLWTEHARLAGIRLGSYDSGGYETAMIACNGVACQLQDIPAAFALLKARCIDPAEYRYAIESAKAEMERRRAGVDAFASQIIGSGSGDSRYDGAVLIALNSSWDSAALGLHTVFDDNSDWIIQTTNFLLENTDAPVIVRQHPAERLAIARTTDDYGALLNRHFGQHPRLHFIAAEDKINSYELFKRVAAVIVYTSTIGIEAAAYGKPVITPSNSYYSDLGFVYKTSNLSEYLNFLGTAAAGNLHVSDSMCEDARLCYYLTQCRNWVFSPFNPADFGKWSRMPLSHWYSDAKVQIVLRSLQENVPVAYLNHLESLSRNSTHQAIA